MPSPHPAVSTSSRQLIQELSPRPPSITTSSYRTTSRPSTASSFEEENSEEESVKPHWTRRHHPYDRTRQNNRPHVSISPSNSRRASLYSHYSRSNDDMGSLLRRGSASASASASADEGSHYGGDSPSASMSPLTTSSPVFTFVGQTRRDREMMADGHLIAGMDMHGSGGGGQSVSSASASAPLSLDSLPSYPPDQKPPFSYPVLIRLAILGSPQKRLLLSQIYSAIEEKFPWYRDSAPKAWKASVRHCLSLNKEFVRMQRAVEDPGVGCGGWWSVGEGMKGLKRPRKRRPAQSKRDHEVDQTPVIKAPVPSPLAIRRRHSTTFDDAHHADPYPRYVSPYSSSSLPPSATSFQPESQTRSTLHHDKAMDVVLPPIEDYSLRLPPLQIPHHAQPLPTPPSSTRTAIFNGIGSDGTKGYSHPSYQVRRGSHTPTASSSSSYSTQSYGSASTSASSSGRANPMSISSLLNGSRGSSGATTVNNGSAVGAMLEEKFDKMDVEMEDARSQIIREMPPQQPPQQKKKDTEMRSGKITPFSSDQTLRPPSPEYEEPPTSTSSHPRRSTTPVAPSGSHRQRGHARPSSRPPSHGHNAGPPRPTRPPPPLPGAEA